MTDDAPVMGHGPQDRLIAAQLGRIYPNSQYAKILHARLIGASGHIADALNVAVGTDVIVRRRITFDGDTPISTSTSWFLGELAALAPDLLKLDRIQAGTSKYIEQQTGLVVIECHETLMASAAGLQVAEDLAIPTGSPVLVGRNWFLAVADKVIEYGEYTTRADRWQTYEFDLTA